MNGEQRGVALPARGAAAGQVAAPSAAGRLRWALRIGGGLWLLLLAVGFVVPGGWVWGMPGPIGHIENYMIALWFVGLVAAPWLASRDPLGQTVGVQVYLLAVLAVVVSTIRGENMKWIADGPPLAVAAVCTGAVVALHPNRRALLAPFLAP